MQYGKSERLYRIAEEPMKTLKISHIGIAVPRIEEQLAFYRDTLSLPLVGVEEVPSQQVRVTFFSVGGSNIELLETTTLESPSQKFLDANQGKARIHHIAYEVEDIEAALAEMKRQGLRLVDETPREGAGGVRIAFVHPRAAGGILTELCEHPKAP